MKQTPMEEKLSWPQKVGKTLAESNIGKTASKAILNPLLKQAKKTSTEIDKNLEKLKSLNF
jgi:hypothetical protein